MGSYIAYILPSCSPRRPEPERDVGSVSKVSMSHTSYEPTPSLESGYNLDIQLALCSFVI